MTFTLSNLIQEFYLRMGQSRNGIATGGDTTYVLDSARDGEGRDKAWLNGTLICTQSSDGLAPDGQFSRISQSVANPWRLTVSPALTAAFGAGDSYAYVGPEYPLYDLIRLANSALLKLGKLDKVDVTTLDSVSNVSRYAASAAWKFPNGPYRVDVASNSDPDDPQWIDEVDTDWEPDEAGEGGYILFRNYPSQAARDIRVWYRESHPVVSSFDDAIDGRLDSELAIQALLSAGLDWNNTRIRGGDKFLLKRSSKAETDLANVKMEQPVEREQGKSKLLTLNWRSRRLWPGDRNPR